MTSECRRCVDANSQGFLLPKMLNAGKEVYTSRKYRVNLIQKHCIFLIINKINFEFGLLNFTVQFHNLTKSLNNVALKSTHLREITLLNLFMMFLTRNRLVSSTFKKQNKDSNEKCDQYVTNTEFLRPTSYI